MRDSRIPLDRKRLIAARKRMGLTQADMAKNAKISLRTVSEYENQEETRLQQLAMHKLTNSISADPYDLWGEIPERASVYASVTKDISKAARWLADGWFNSLDVIGMPRDFEHRDPLIKVLRISEEAKDFQNRKLSDLMLRRFECVDCLNLLSRESAESKAVDSERELPKVQFAIEHVPRLKCVLDRNINSDTGKEENFVQYQWSTLINAYIDFEGTDFDTQGKSYNYVSGYKYHLPAFYDTGFKVEKLSMDELLAEEVRALNARPVIEFKEEEIKLSAENLVAGTPDLGQPAVDRDPKEPDKKLKEDES